MRGKLAVGLLALVLVLSVVAVGCGSDTTETTTAPVTTVGGTTDTTVAEATTTTEAGPVIELRLANYFGTDTLQGQLLQQFCDDINTRTNGQVKMTYYPGGQLFDGPGTLDGIKNKVADIGYMTTGHFSGVFPVSESITSLNGYPSAYVVSHVAEDFYNEFQPEEWNDYHVLFVDGHSPMMLFSMKPIRTLADFAGTKCRVKGLQAEQAKLLGSSTIDIPAGDQFDALQKGVIDNSAISMEAAKTWSLADIAPYLTLTWQVFSPPQYYLVMNKTSWDSLPDNVKTVFDEVSAEYVEKAALMCNQVDLDGAAYAEEKGMEFIDLAPEEAQKWVDAVAPVSEAYVQKMITAGFPEAEVRGWITYIQDRTAFWLAEQAKAGIKSPMGPAEIKQ